MLGSPLSNHGTAAQAALRPQIDDMICAFDDIQVMLDNEHGITRIHQTLQDHQQLPHILEMQPGSGLIQNIERFARLTTMQLACKLHALSFTA